MAWDQLLQRADRSLTAVLGKKLLRYRTSQGEIIDLFDPVTKRPRAIFVDEAKSLTNEMEAPLRESGPQCQIRLEDLKVGDILIDPEDDAGQILNGDDVYDVREVRPDGEGGALLLLNRFMGG